MAQEITIIGAGFAALTAIREIRKSDQDIKITLIAPKAEFIFLPSLIWIPSGQRTGDDLRINLDAFFKKHNIHFFAGSVTAIQDGGRTVITDNGEIKNDALIIASGGRFIKKLPGIEHAITICEGIEAAEKMRDKIKAMDGGTITLGFGGNPKEPSAMRGGPMFELLFGLDTQLRQEGRRDKFKLVFFSPAPKPGARLGENAVKGILKQMETRGIETHLGHKMKHFTENKVTTEGGEIDTDLIIFMPGMTGPSFAANTEMPLSPGGLIQSNMNCEVEGFEHCYVAGDAGSFPGPDWKPKQAHMADLQAEAAAKNLLDGLKGKAATHTFKYELACIIDSNDKGTLAFRNEKRTITIPPCRLLHYVKKGFEWNYLRTYRNP
ncbi:FAD-dependent oxidoreductase [Cocleimonas sp. KMM 6892]|uniref:NAD(P)/FAD-dependent oxidoreductase n=1 Tax=unclassified Cocleimonas TaxID=2639732 RepID=UPI002DBE7197|nr:MULTISPECIES: FAD-dependent oxidoreductase [unclassified Cocleimonas]MEB8430989.1 FAD-dependent oxidoreductase [Cocleimonas sp. KMM 6892]MEC4714239.1 FAD-dependent oxidoreductase [Cocleimonas sp. KMM 6895]MEC4743570.1 FAD-dependent oxidoreductase [Cocleimonas sp. KMM 6896]